MNILIINHYCGNEELGMEHRHFHLGQALVEKGHSVTVVAASYSHLRVKQPKVEGRSSVEVIKGITYFWVRSAPYSVNGVWRFWNILTFIGNLFLLASKILRHSAPDVVINSSTYPMDIWPAKYFAKRCKAKLVFELHDLWPLSPKQIGGMSDKHPFIMLCQAAENDIYRSVDGVISLLPAVKPYMESKGILPERLLISPNGYQTSEVTEPLASPLPQEIEEYIAQARKMGKVIVVYAGSMGIANALDNLLESAKIVSRLNFSFILVGSGLEAGRLRARAHSENINNTMFFDPISKVQIPYLLALCDIGYLGAPRLPLYQYGVSQNKFIDYTLASLPVLNATEAGNNVIDDVCCGITVEPESPQALANGLVEFVAMSAQARIEMGRRGRAYTLANLNYDILSAKYLQFLERL